MNNSEVGNAIEKELDRQCRNIELIASENIVFEAVLVAAGTVLTNKYPEGYPRKRYNGGFYCVDKVETIAIDSEKPTVNSALRLVRPAVTSLGLVFFEIK